MTSGRSGESTRRSLEREWLPPTSRIRSYRCAAAREVLRRVVDDMVGADRRDDSRVPVLVTPVTSAPSALAIWTAKVPTPPPAPLMSTR